MDVKANLFCSDALLTGCLLKLSDFAICLRKNSNFNHIVSTNEEERWLKK